MANQVQLNKDLTAPVAAISRHRILLDGDGVRTLVIFQGCPLRCAYCLNTFAMDEKVVRERYTVEQLIEQLMPDNLYFLATMGGITFGGGEPASQSAFITRFRELCPSAWTIHIETALNVPRHHIEQLLPVVQRFVVDIKDMAPDIYYRYTGKDNQQVISNLSWLVEQGRVNDIIVRVPLISNYNTLSNQAHSIAQLQDMGITHFDQFTYRLPQWMVDIDNSTMGLMSPKE